MTTYHISQNIYIIYLSYVNINYPVTGWKWIIDAMENIIVVFDTIKTPM